MNRDIAILLPYKEKFDINKASAVSIWVNDYLSLSKLKDRSIVYGNLEKNDNPLVKDFRNIELKNTYVRKNIAYTSQLYKDHLKNNFKIIELHNRPESLVYLIKKKINCKLIFTFHNNPKELRSSSTIAERIFIAENTDQIYFVSKWVRDKFFEGLPYKNKNNCEILYPAIKQLKKFPKKEKLIMFCGKLNSSKGYDLFGNAIIRILDKYMDWKAIAIGNEPREKFNFKHKNFKILDWSSHKKTLEFYSKASISVVPSRWLEPFGRTAMESAAYGCATITTRNGGLPETFNNNLYLEDITSKGLYILIEKLILSPGLIKKVQRKNFSNVIHKIEDKVRKIDSFKNFLLVNKLNFTNTKKLKILHISNFDERNDYRLFNISIANKLSKGLILNNHDVINLSYRNYLSKFLIKDKNNLINKKIEAIADNYRPDLIVLGHNNSLYSSVIEKIKKKYNTKFSLWYEDALGKNGDGPNWKNNLNLIEKNHDLIDTYFTTTHPSEIYTTIKKNKINFFPILADPNIENLKIYENKNRFKDLFFALSHGVNYGKLKRGRKDEREIFIKELLNRYENINFNILGIANEPPKWNYSYYRELQKCKMALNLSRGKPLKYTSSNRIASLIANGIYTFIDIKTHYDDFFDNDEMGFYKDINDLGNKIEKIKSNPTKYNKYSNNGKKRYFELFNSKLISDYMISKTFDIKMKKKVFWDK